ncbi:hypothetical protein M011DRAFT_59566 [Sporormia fimetaria CBS 119925]|uniref:Uncharacterized protein n=1 Tax=Sporormia fimetaria CBS 119925 TaxID=1340428 RepID=A0A6A6V9X6_9PLEO|nr:hypothetical protein M011DRAFT_59566 [Sporormia fimetaria CBS 119925]
MNRWCEMRKPCPQNLQGSWSLQVRPSAALPFLPHPAPSREVLASSSRPPFHNLTLLSTQHHRHSLNTFRSRLTKSLLFLTLFDCALSAACRQLTAATRCFAVSLLRYTPDARFRNTSSQPPCPHSGRAFLRSRDKTQHCYTTSFALVPCLVLYGARASFRLEILHHRQTRPAQLHLLILSCRLSIGPYLYLRRTGRLIWHRRSALGSCWAIVCALGQSLIDSIQRPCLARSRPRRTV